MALEKLPKKHAPSPLSSDRISHLPNALLLHILSFLPSKTVIQTSVLSTRWRYLWTSIPTLDFNEELFPFPMPQSQNTQVNAVIVKNTNFMDFVDRALMLHDNSDIYKLRLSYRNCFCDTLRAHIWIRSAVSSNVREIDLNIGVMKGAGAGAVFEFQFPRCVFASESLAALKLNLHYGVLKLPTGIGFGSLKTLYLARVNFGNQNLKLFSKSPLLEYLSISYCQMNDLYIFALKLETLIVEGSYEKIKIRVYAPSLRSFKFIGPAPKNWDLEILSSLVEAYLNIGARYDEESGINMGKLIKAVSKAEVLTLSKQCFEVLFRDPNLSKWLRNLNCNLKRLTLTTVLGYVEGIQKIACFLVRCINLKVLSITIKPFHSWSKYTIMSSPLKCPLNHLKEVEIKDFEGHEYQLELVKFFLMNAKIMERMVIYTTSEGWADTKKRMAVNKKLLTFPRASSSVMILFS